MYVECRNEISAIDFIGPMVHDNIHVTLLTSDADASHTNWLQIPWCSVVAQIMITVNT